jgi:pimeloyl-ACP methyl ester carboxylesterase
VDRDNWSSKFHQVFTPIHFCINQNKKRMKKIFKLTIAIGLVLIANIATAQDLISVETKGSGTPLILLHGMACSSEVWDEVIETLDGNYEFHIVSIKGFGNSSKSNQSHYLEAIRDEVIGYIQTNNLKSPVLMGHSMGGFLGLWIAAVQPDLLAKVISVDGVPYFPSLQMPGMTPEAAKEMTKQIQESMQAQSPEQALANQRMMASTMIATEDKREKVVQMGINSNPEVIAQAFAEMYTNDIRPLMPQIKIPVLVLGSWAAYEAYATKEQIHANFMSQLNDIPNIRFELAETAYHLIFYDEPEWFNQQVNTFLVN